jgi:hypothetical protein
MFLNEPLWRGAVAAAGPAVRHRAIGFRAAGHAAVLGRDDTPIILDLWKTRARVNCTRNA